MWKTKPENSTNQPVKRMLYFGVQQLNEQYFERLMNLDPESITVEDQESLKDFLFSIYDSQDLIHPFYTELSLNLFTKEMFYRFTDSSEFRNHFGIVLSEVLRPFSEEVYAYHCVHRKFKGQEDQTPHLVQTYVVRELVNVFHDIFMGCGQLVFFETLIEQIVEGQSLSKDVAIKIQKMMERKKDVKNLFTRGSSEFYKKMLKDKEIPTLYSRKEWRALVLRVMKNSFGEHDAIVSRMTNYSLGRFVEASETEFIQFDLEIPWNAESHEKREIYRLGSEYLGATGKVDVKRESDSNGNGWIFVSLQLNHHVGYGPFCFEEFKFQVNASETGKEQAQAQSCIRYGYSSDLFENNTKVDLCIKFNLVVK